MINTVRRAAIVSVAAAVPEKIVTNDDLTKMGLDTADDWIVSRTGIKQRRVVEPHVAASDLATEAARKALDRAVVHPEEIDLIIVATVTGDMPFPATACFVQANLGAKNAAAFDLSAACPGFLYALTVGNQFIASGQYQTILVIGVEILSKAVDWQDRATCVLFGDGAGAAVLKAATADRGILSCVLGSDGTATHLLNLPGGGSRYPASHETIENRMHYLRMNGPEVFKMAVRVMNEAAGQAIEKAGLTRDQIDLVIPHQANLRIIDATAKRLGIPWEKIVVNVQEYGNTSSATIPIAMEESVINGRLKDGDTIIVVSFGAGFAWAALAIRWGA